MLRPLLLDQTLVHSFHAKQSQTTDNWVLLKKKKKVYIYIYIYIFVYIYVYTHIYIYIYLFMYLWIESLFAVHQARRMGSSCSNTPNSQTAFRREFSKATLDVGVAACVISSWNFFSLVGILRYFWLQLT